MSGETDARVEEALARAADNDLWPAVLGILRECMEREMDAAIAPPPAVSGESRAYNAGRASGIADAISYLEHRQEEADFGRRDSV